MTVVKTTKAGSKIFKCPGCKGYHTLPIKPAPNPSWEFNGDHSKPTFKPSILARAPFRAEDGGEEICHSFVMEGMIQFLTDCTHAFVGKTVEIPPWPHAPGTFGGIVD